ncbi:glycyl-radical enzyme activating protein [Thermosyntropha lipolytica DSM 11003]|uniref:Glycyl-radical enzyme activating protein n=1 Tax=Thermosyntropha lipolytica DSM 11003 TaxID=1123382 RepID=A0A1M5LU73_9FIRM|nr:4-hydroxyphenylacetate decarboxylase activase [Thermosyntropha lipolytica]SHG68664.1 glycyl-radical enzyme activating protein [Thermosyntropha lipolytica DSM 11003]
MNREGKKGLIFDIQSYSVHDGPGCRTLIFMSGCPLRCEWCANPEGLLVKKQVMFSNIKCKHDSYNCMYCIDACPHDAIKVSPQGENLLYFERNLCLNCDEFLCAAACPYEAIRIVGKWMSVDDLIYILDRDRQYWGSGGGVTFSGGEPLVQHEFLQEMLMLCKDKYIHTAIETSAYVDTGIFLRAFRYIDFAFIDVKHMDDEQHRAKTGVSNKLILHNIRALTESGWQGRLVLRMPVIRGYNDSAENINMIIRFMKELGLFEINILPFHRLGDSKWKQLGLVYKYANESATPREKLEEIQDQFLEARIACYIGHETCF